MSITNRADYTILAGGAVRAAGVFGDWIYITPSVGAPDITLVALYIALNGEGGFPAKFGDKVSTLNKDGSRAASIIIGNTGTGVAGLNVCSGIGDFQPAFYSDGDGIAHADATTINASIVAAEAQAHADAVALNSNLVAAAVQAHSDAGAIATDVVAVTAAVVAAEAQAHSDAVAINGNIVTAAGQAHADAGALDTDLVAFKNANHTDLGALDTDLVAFKNANHTDLGTLNTNLGVVNGNVVAVKTSVDQVDAYVLAFKGVNHTDLVTINNNIGAAATAAHNDALAIEAAIAAAASGQVKVTANATGIHTANGTPSTANPVGAAAAPQLLLIAAYLEVLSTGGGAGAARLVVTKASAQRIVLLGCRSAGLAQGASAMLPLPYLLEVGDALTLENDANATSEVDVSFATP